jgi:Family of unknown function (DUF6498)
MSQSRFVLPTFGSVAPDLAAFFLGLGSMRLLGWSTTDLVWSLWLCSLTIGYLTILSVIFRWVCIGAVALTAPEFTAQQRGKTVLIGLGVAFFFLAFFSIHFCGFHQVHAVFLASYFPLAGVPANAFATGFLRPLAFLANALHYLLPKYGVFSRGYRLSSGSATSCAAPRVSPI